MKEGAVKSEDVRNYEIESDLVCIECRTKDEIKDLKKEDIIPAHEVEGDDYYFCDRCKE